MSEDLAEAANRLLARLEESSRERRQHGAFQAYAAAKMRADETLDFRDAMAAGRAWRIFLNLFLEPENHLELDTNIIEFPRRGRR